MSLKKRHKNKEPLDKVAKLYLGYKFFGALYFSYPIFYEFASQTITPIQIGLFFSVIGICGFAAEIPTGIIADKRSRKFSGLFGMTMLVIAPLVIYFGHTFSAYLLAALFYGIGRAFLNGALDSLVYDHKNIDNAAYRRVNAHEITFGQAGILVGAACGGLLFSVNHSAPFIADAVTGIICLILIAFMQEQHKDSFVKTKTSHSQHFIQSMKLLVATRYLKVIVTMGVLFSVMLGMCIQFVNEAAMIELSFQASTRGFLIAGAGIATLVVLNLFLLKLLKSDEARIIYMGCGAVAAYTLMSIGLVPLFLFGYLLWCCLNATSSFIRVILQDQIPSTHRSTILSSFKSLAILIGLGASTSTGLLVQWAHTPRAAYLLFAFIALVILLPCTLWIIRHLRMNPNHSVPSLSKTD
jgi:predicted MFS family arabinose efflux permease